MTAENFEPSLKRVLVHEGGYSNDKGDPGGATMWGITHFDYDAYRRRRGLPVQDVRKMTVTERDDIYKSKYWLGARCDELPSGVDYAVFDGAVNSGVAQSVKWLQRALGVTVDGHIGEITIDAAHDAHVETLIRSMCDQRLTFLRNLRTFSRFGKGWMRRVDEVQNTALGMVHDVEYEGGRPAPADTGAKAKAVDLATPVVDQTTATAATAGTASASAIVQQIQEQLSPFSETLTAIKYALIVCAVIGLGFTIYAMIRSKKLQEV
jgi:lysozyme family protein